MADLPGAQRADAQGPDLRAHRRGGGGRHHVAARDARRRAQLGLPLHLDPRLDVCAVGPVHASASTGRRTTSSYFIADVAGQRGRAADDVRHRRRARAGGAGALDHLHGYEGARPVRIGNGAYKQRQHDMWGAVLDSVYLHTRSRDRLDERDLADPGQARWSRRSSTGSEPDRGIWEVRGEPKHFTSSKVMCWVACDRGARLAAAARGRRAAPHAGRRPPTRSSADICAQRRRRARRVHPALRHRRRSTPRCC